MSLIVVPNFFSSPILIPAPKAGEHTPLRRFVTVRLDDGDWLLPQGLMDRAAPYSGDRLYEGTGRLLAEFVHDADVFASHGLDATWKDRFAKNMEAMFKLWEAQKSAGDQGVVERQLALGDDDLAVVAARRIVNLAAVAGLRHLFGRTALDLQSYAGRRTALRVIAARAQNATVRAQLKQIGVTDEMLGTVDALRGSLQENTKKRSRGAADARMDSRPVQAAKAMVLGNMERASKIGRTELPRDRWAHYRLGTLLKTPGRARGKGTPAQPGAGTPPHGSRGKGTPGPAPVVDPAPPLHGAQGLPPGAMPLVGDPGPVASGVAAHAAPASTPAGAAAGPAAAPGPPAVDVPTHALPAGVPALKPGTILCTLPTNGGPPVYAVVQLDGSIGWMAAAPPAAPAPPATPATKGRHRQPRQKAAPASPTPAAPAEKPPARKRHQRR